MAIFDISKKFHKCSGGGSGLTSSVDTRNANFVGQFSSYPIVHRYYNEKPREGSSPSCCTN